MSNPAMSHPHSFWDNLAERYSKKPVADEAAYQRKLDVTRGYLRPDMEVMEFGCGTGTTAIAHAPHVSHILATDISAKMIEIAGNKAAAAGIANVTFEQADIEGYSAPDGSFDAVMGHSILHLVEDRDPVIAKVFRMLKPGGVFVTNTACLGDRMKFFRYVGPVGRFFGLMPMVRVFSIGELTESLVRAGFSIDYKWKPEKGQSVFIVAKKPG